MNIKPYDTRIQALFQSGFYKIPRFQRPYSWDKDNIEDFWADIIASGRLGHFIGSMVLYPGNNEQERFVVDGQQRLTTITIFLAALRDTLTEVGEAALAAGIQGIIERPDINAQNRYVLLTETSYPYFQEYIQKHGAPELKVEPGDEETGLRSAYEFAISGFRQLIEKIRESETDTAAQKAKIKGRLEQARNALLSLDLIVILLDNEDDAYTVFETLNTRGRDLEPKDLIKNLITKLLRPTSADVDVTKIKWNSMVAELANSIANLDLSTYLHHYWLSRFDYTAERNLFEKVKAYVKPENASAFLNEISSDAATYRRIFEPNSFKWATEEEPLRQSLIALGIFKVRQPTPMILALLRAYYAKQISLKQVRTTVAIIERFHFLYTAVAGLSSSGGVSKMYAAAARDLSTETEAQKRAKHLRDFRAKLMTKMPEKAAFLAGFSGIRYSQKETRERALVRHILSKIDASKRKDAVIDYSKMTIEHLAPENPPAGVPLAANFAMIGNLMLLPSELNGEQLGNKNLSEKKAILTTAGVALDEHISKASTWGDAEITARTNAMAEFLFTNRI